MSPYRPSDDLPPTDERGPDPADVRYCAEHDTLYTTDGRCLACAEGNA